MFLVLENFVRKIQYKCIRCFCLLPHHEEKLGQTRLMACLGMMAGWFQLPPGGGKTPLEAGSSNGILRHVGCERGGEEEVKSGYSTHAWSVKLVVKGKCL